MRVFILLALVGTVFTSDITTCQKKCSAKYDEAEIPLSACNFGCESRGSINEGFSAFVNCQDKCDAKFENSTDEDAACRYACSLPMSSSVFMTMDYSGKDPQWKVVKQEGNIPSSLLDILRPSDINGNLLALKAPASQEVGSEEDMENSEDTAEMEQKISQIHSHMDKIMQQFAHDFFNRIRAQMESNGVAVSRPENHDPFAFGSSHVDNFADDNSPIIVSKPVSSDLGDGRRGYFVEIRGDRPRRFFATLHWALIGIGAAALLTTICAALLFLHNFKSNNYRRMRGEAIFPVFGKIHGSAPACPVKKAPEEWLENSKPSGVPPPAYDQVSVHEQKTEDPHNDS